ncbi:hypothetical protein Pelo_18382 [Pelomyxa schiedti]|nr:hypothetical protein Pelo_18382 [Pelomyxa schiedti]
MASLATNESTSSRHVLEVSRVVLDMVVRPGWLDNDNDDDDDEQSRYVNEMCRNTDLFRVGEAMFPLVGVVCSRAIALCRSRCGCRGSSRYSVIASAASVPASHCVAWLINNRDWCFRNDPHTNNNGTRNVALPPTPKTTVTNETISSSHRGGTTTRDWGESLSAVKEVVAALMGLCIGGHLLMAKAMLGFGASDGGQCLWDGWGVVGWGLLDK